MAAPENYFSRLLLGFLFFACAVQGKQYIA